MTERFWETGGQFNGEEGARQDLPKIHVLTDGDIVAYRAAASCDGRYYEVNGNRFAYKKEATSFCDKKSIPNSEIVSGFEPEPEENSLHNTAVTIDAIKHYYIYERKLNPIIKVFLSAPTNFRHKLFPDYKKSRVGIRKPQHLAKCKEYLVDQFKGFRYEGFEADDLIAMMVTALKESCEDPIAIASNDKDFTQLGGERVEQYDFTTNKVWTVEPGEARYYFYKQILVGDRSDDIPGLPGVGPQTAIKILGGNTEERDLYNAVVMAYQDKMSLTKEEAVDAVSLRGKLLYLMRVEDVVWTAPLPREKV